MLATLACGRHICIEAASLENSFELSRSEPLLRQHYSFIGGGQGGEVRIEARGTAGAAVRVVLQHDDPTTPSIDPSGGFTALESVGDAGVTPALRWSLSTGSQQAMTYPVSSGFAFVAELVEGESAHLDVLTTARAHTTCGTDFALGVVRD